MSQISSIMAKDQSLVSTESEYDEFNRACDFLRELSMPMCTADQPACWTAWVSPSVDALPASWRTLPFAQYFTMPSSLMSDRLVLTMICLLVVGAIYVLRRGDDGYTCGRAKQTLPDLLQFLWRSTCACARGKPAHTVTFAEDSEDGKGSHLKPQNAEDSDVAVVGTSVSLGRSTIIVSASDSYVAIPVLRVDDAEGTSRVTVRTRNGIEGNPALLGRDYGALRPCPKSEPPVVQNKLVLEFEPRTRLKFVYVDLLAREKRVTGEHDLADFWIDLSSAEERASAGACAIGPVKHCNVRVIKLEAFPSLHLKLLSSSNPDNSKAVLKRNASALSASNVVYAPSKISDVYWRFALVQAFLREIFRINGLKRKVFWHQLTCIYLAFIDSFIYPIMYSYIIAFGVQAQRTDMAMWIALLMMLLLLIKFRIKLNYFHGSTLVMQHMRSMLARKFLSLRRDDHNRDPNIAQDFRVAIHITCDEIRSQTYEGVFHNGLPHVYGVIMSTLYVLVFQFSNFTLIALAGLVPISLIWYMLRARRGAAIAMLEFSLLREVEEKLENLVQNWRLVQESGGEQNVARQVFDGFEKLIDKGLWVTGYHRFYTSWFYTSVRLLVLYVLWLISPTFIGETANFVALNTALGSLGSSLQVRARSRPRKHMHLNCRFLTHASQLTHPLAAAGRWRGRARRTCVDRQAGGGVRPAQLRDSRAQRGTKGCRNANGRARRRCGRARRCHPALAGQRGGRAGHHTTNRGDARDLHTLRGDQGSGCRCGRRDV